MKHLFKSLAAAALAFAASATFASPAYLITHNKTNVESNAYVAGVPSPHPTRANADGKVSWLAVRLACNGHVNKEGRCAAVIKMATDTASPVDLGTVSVHVDTGDIIPKQISGNGYTLTVNGPGEATLTKN
ncbi:hypothetical protein [Legionella jordanis]|uniref:Uncharacterized protein n=1 Tax=Legionella jordanis TaxID=456 RepID=A0A0W0V8R3_9GAMM|nr:hypothetical protein [Legionella jordanis]KTD16526.1 hypothetical protein Ljor_0832 [Legionella jordanis]RMX03931.1 hypothetical protein EAW55_06130 [Legionella jordanis]RMX22001.1 hypothetical protein EAS68_00280 [Legionella jordanis]VEH12013.1 Uncharacterised protein [Legionella jordanis]HAT8712684.1 hypothetical protein [Legionella jordanis]